MRLTFVIPAYNEEKRIQKCLDSVITAIERSRREIEIIVVDNASSDRTAEVVSRYPKVRLVREPRKGIVFARRRGLLEASGDLIANIDADTFLTPHWIETVFEEFRKNPNLVCLSGPFVYYDLPLAASLLVKGLFYPISFLAYLVNRFVLRRGSLIQGGNFVLRREALEKIGGYNTNINFYGEDTDIALRMHDVGQVKFTFGLPIYASGRRLAGEGIFTMGIRYGANYLSMAILGRPATKTSIDVRGINPNGTLKYNPLNKSKEFAIASATTIILLGILFGIGYAAWRILFR